jgi:hypothetical protein
MRRGTVGARRGSVQARRSKGHFPFYRGSVDAGCRVANLGGSFYTDLFHATTQPICTLVRSQGVALIAVDGKSTPRCQLHRARTPTLSCMQTASCAPVRGSFRRCVFNVPSPQIPGFGTTVSAGGVAAVYMDRVKAGVYPYMYWAGIPPLAPSWLRPTRLHVTRRECARQAPPLKRFGVCSDTRSVYLSEPSCACEP